MGGPDEDSNYVLLTSKEHLLAHKLLYEIFPENISLLNAITCMFLSGRGNVRQLNLSISEVAYYREKFYTESKGQKRSEEGKKNIAKAQFKRFSDPKEREKLSKSHVGKKASDETKRKCLRLIKRNILDLRRNLW